MERQLLWALYQRLLTLGHKTPPGYSHSDLSIALTYLWSTLSDRPVSWATKREHWPSAFLCCDLPSPATMSRRLRTKSVRKLLVKLLRALQRSWTRAPVWFIDGKPLPVGGSSGDQDAKAGRGAGLLARGYKLHAMIQASGQVEALMVLPMNVNEAKAARTLLKAACPKITRRQAYLVGDAAYDATALYDLAAARGLQLVARPRKARLGLGHKRQSPHRLRGLEIAHTPQGRALLKARFGIDRMFGSWGNTAGGMGPLPNWVRRLHRVRLWVLAKIVILAQIRTQKYGLAL
jgi:hypothetical protein